MEEVRGGNKGGKGVADSGKTGLGRGFRGKEGTHSGPTRNLETARKNPNISFLVL